MSKVPRKITKKVKRKKSLDEKNFYLAIIVAIVTIIGTVSALVGQWWSISSANKTQIGQNTSSNTTNPSVTANSTATQPPTVTQNSNAEKTVVFFNNNELYLDREPQIIEDEILLPFLEIVQQMGASTEWDKVQHKAVAYLNGNYVKICENDFFVTYGTYTDIDDVEGGTDIISIARSKLVMPPITMNGDVLVPLTIFNSFFGAYVIWDKDTYAVDITYKDKQADETTLDDGTNINNLKAVIDFDKKIELEIGESYIYIDGMRSEMSASVYISAVNDLTMVPLDCLAKAFGLTDAELVWNNNMLTIFHPTKTIQFIVNSDKLTINGVTETMVDMQGNSIESEILIGKDYVHLFVPFRILAHAFDINVLWDGNTQTITYNSDK